MLPKKRIVLWNCQFSQSQLSTSQIHNFILQLHRIFYNIYSIFSDAVAGGLLGEAKRDANKTRILLGLFKEPEVPELENEDEQLDDLEPSKKKRKNKAITVRDPQTKTGRLPD